MGFLPEPAVQGYFDISGAVHWITAASPEQNRVYGNQFSGGNAYAFQYNFETGQEIDNANLTSFGSSPAALTGVFLLDPNGRFWVAGGTTEFHEFETGGTPWTVLQQWGSGSNPPTGVQPPQSMAWLAVGGKSYIVGGSLTGSKVWVIETDDGNIGYGGSNFSISGTAQICTGPETPTLATAYWTTYANTGTAPQFGKTTIDNDGNVVNTQLATYIATQFDAGWTQINSFLGPAYDSTDGDVLVLAGGGVDATSTWYLVKLDVADGSIIWKTGPLSDEFEIDGHALTQSRIQAGLFFMYLSTGAFSATIYAFKTSDGSSTTTNYTGLAGINFPQSDDFAGCLIGNASWDSGEGSIDLLNGTPSTGSGELAAIFVYTPSESGASGDGGTYTEFFGDGV